MAGGLSDFHVMKCTNSEQYPEDEDRISLLSTDILVHILSFLKLKEAARTSLVSKLWVGLWMFAVVQLDFDASKVLLEIAAVRSEPSFLSKKRCHYVEWVNKVLQSHKAMVIDEFRICFELDESSQDDVDEWLLYAFAKRVKSLQLDFLQFGMPTAFVLEPYLFPSCRIFDQNVEENSIESLSIIHTKSFRTLRVTDFQSLRSLRLAGVDVTGETLHFLMEKFHLLEHLVVIGSQSEDLSSVLVCGSSSLKYLELTHCRCLKSIIVRDARHLVSLKYTWVSNVVLENVPELVDVWVSGWKFSRMILQLSSLLTRLESLTLRVSNSDVNEDVTRFLKVPHPIGLKQLTLDVRASEDDSLLRLTSSFMKSCPNLEKFVLKLHWLPSCCISNRQFKRVPSRPHKCLKVFEFQGYYGRKADDEIIMYFLKNGTALERIILDPRCQTFCFRQRIREPRTEIARIRAEELFKGLIRPSVELVI